MEPRPTNFATADAKALVSELFDRAEAGERLAVGRRGRPVARLAPIAETPDEATARRRHARLDWIAYRTEQGITLGSDLTIRDLIDDGRS